jgi:hypothetical protein
MTNDHYRPSTLSFDVFLEDEVSTWIWFCSRGGGGGNIQVCEEYCVSQLRHASWLGTRPPERTI